MKFIAAILALQLLLARGLLLLQLLLPPPLS